MSNQKSQIPRLTLASSCGNLTKIDSRVNLSSKHVHENSNSQNHINVTLNRQSMIDAPIPITHRRMFSHHQRSRPPWAVDDSLNPFSQEMDYGKPKQRHNDHCVQTLVTPEMMFYRVDSPPLSIDNTIDESNHQSYYQNESAYKEEVKHYSNSLSTGIQTDMSGDEFYPECKANKSYNKSTEKNTYSNQEKRSVIPLKELKRNNQKNNLTYKINPKKPSPKDAVDFDKLFDKEEKIEYNTEKEIQSRIDYWLNKRVSLQNNVIPFENKNTSSDSENVMFRNQITLTSRNSRSQGALNRLVTTPSPIPSSPQTIEAIVIQSDSDSERDYIVSSRSLESRSPKPRSHFKIQANLAPRTQSSNQNEILSNGNTKCNVCGDHLSSGNQMKCSGIICHRECFICFWCKKKLSSDSYKINKQRLCCPLHFRLL